MNEIVAINLICKDGSMIVLKTEGMTIIDKKIIAGIQKDAVQGDAGKQIQQQLASTLGKNQSEES
ncbi:hypothetical protein [Leptospira stimsonii]|uniref:Uncharacterized protein n=1 Tax=Leptospira stimsonii TaxID=2202203 RepID=A0ABY2MV19_9LEPT|nr:hypothetical protein [Leptospira stimsonii]TGK25391.1 hypothetical protein EHO98_03050 [Leptospira stimsonii]TGM08810.1 hypothetical protein EHQ90_22235 [Leptospira stimsonii]